MARALLPHTGRQQGPIEKQRTGRLHPWAQLWPPSRPVWPAKATICGKGVEKGCGAMHSPHPPGNFVLFMPWWMLTEEICHEEGTGATSGSKTAPDREQWDRQKTPQSQDKQFSCLANELQSPAKTWGCSQHQRQPPGFRGKCWPKKWLTTLQHPCLAPKHSL